MTAYPEPVTTGITLTDDELARLRKLIEDQWRRRAVEQGYTKGKKRDRAELEFLCGAMATYYALGLWDKVPPIWLLAPLSGRYPIIKDEEGSNG